MATETSPRQKGYPVGVHRRIPGCAGRSTDGLPATTHHDYLDKFAAEFPKVRIVRSVRYVQSDPTIYTAGGLTSGVDLALHIVEGYFGHEVAQKTADYMEYQGSGWKSAPEVSPHAFADQDIGQLKTATRLNPFASIWRAARGVCSRGGAARFTIPFAVS